jgi:hypothetical protein
MPFMSKEQQYIQPRPDDIIMEKNSHGVFIFNKKKDNTLHEAAKEELNEARKQLTKEVLSLTIFTGIGMGSIIAGLSFLLDNSGASKLFGAVALVAGASVLITELPDGISLHKKIKEYKSNKNTFKSHKT